MGRRKYDFDYQSNDKLSYDILDTNIGICSTYSRLYEALVQAQGIPCICVSGKLYPGYYENIALDAEGHAWNEAYVDGRWVIMDVTCDSCNTYTNAKGYVYGGHDMHYFDMSLDLFSYDHLIVNRGPTSVSNSKIAQFSLTKVQVGTKTFNIEAYNIEGYNYYKIRSIAAILANSSKGFLVGWDGSTNTVNIDTSSNAYVAAKTDLTLLNHESVLTQQSLANLNIDSIKMNIKSYCIDGSNFFMLRDIARLLNFEVSWNSTVNTIDIDPTKNYSY